MKMAKLDVVHSVEEKYRILFYEIIDILINHLLAHFSNSAKMEFFILLCFEKLDTYMFKAAFPEKLALVCDGIFYCAWMRTKKTKCPLSLIRHQRKISLWNTTTVSQHEHGYHF
jgi:hypothetical protein